MAAPYYQKDWRKLERGEACGHCHRKNAGCIVFEHGGIGCMHTTEGDPFPSGQFLHVRKVNWPAPGSNPWRGSPRVSTPAPAPEPPRVPLADVQDRDAVYRCLLASCPLSASDRAYLERCGVPAGEMAGYGTLRPGVVIGGEGQEALMPGIPGFKRRQDGAWAPVLSSGLLMASYDVFGRVQGLRARVQPAGGDKRYLWLSSAACSIGTPATVVRPAELRDATTVYLTEGEKKAHLCALRTGCITIGLAGIGCWAAAEAALRQLRSEGCYRVIVALDEDDKPKTREDVDRCRQSVGELAIQCGFAVELARWDGAQGKGIDDLPAGYMPRCEVWVPAAATEGGARAIVQLTREALRAPIGDAELRTLLYIVGRDGAKEGPLKQTWMNDAAAGSGLIHGCKTPEAAAKKAGRAILDLEARHLVKREESKDAETSRKRGATAFLPAGLAALPKVLQPTIRREKDAQRLKKCHDCGAYAVRSICTACGAYQDDPPASGPNGPSPFYERPAAPGPKSLGEARLYGSQGGSIGEARLGSPADPLPGFDVPAAATAGCHRPGGHLWRSWSHKEGLWCDWCGAEKPADGPRTAVPCQLDSWQPARGQ